MADRRAGVGRFKMFRGSDSTSGTGGATGTLIQDSLAPLDGQERLSMRINQRRDISGVTQLSGVQGNPIVDGIRLQRFGKYEIVSRDPIDYSTLTANNNDPADPPVVPPVPDATCCTSLWVNHWSIMKHSETQTLAAEPSLYGCTYYWEVRECSPTTWGCGSLSHHPPGSTERGVLYNSPYMSPGDCDKEIRVRCRVSVLESDGPTKKSGSKDESWKSIDLIAGTDEMTGAVICYYDFDFSVSGDTCPRPDYCVGARLSYTTLQMQKSESQTLNAHPAAAGDRFSWTLSGGGSLNKTTGATVVYTAPSSNANCSSNPTISLYCDGILVDSITIAVNAVTGTNTAYFKATDRGCWIKPWSPVTWCGVYINLYYCNGALNPNTYFSNNCSQVASHMGGCDACRNASVAPRCGMGNRTINEILALPNDWRTPEMIANGCCPYQLL